MCGKVSQWGSLWTSEKYLVESRSFACNGCLCVRKGKRFSIETWRVVVVVYNWRTMAGRNARGN